MNDNAASTAANTTQRRRWTRRRFWGGALAVAVGVGSLTLFLGAFPDARAVAAETGGGGPGAFLAHMHGGGKDHAAMHAHFDKVLDDAGVSEAQKLQIHGIMKTAMADTHADLRRYHAGVGQLTTLTLPVGTAAPHRSSPVPPQPCVAQGYPARGRRPGLSRLGCVEVTD